MSNASKIIGEIDHFLDKFSLRKNRLTNQDLIDYIEEKWYQADDEKYKIHQGSIFIGRMINEYIKLKDYDNMKRWLDMMNIHALSEKHPEYINNYYSGECCLKCGNEEKALVYFQLCYKENPEYIFTRAPFCYEFFNKHLENPKELPKRETAKVFKAKNKTIELKEWQLFFNAENRRIRYEMLLDDSSKVEKPNAIHKKGLEYLQHNQAKILENILTALQKKYPGLQKTYNYEDADKQDFMPDITQIKDFADLLSPACLYVLSVQKDDFPYIGFGFSCSWDAEHGLGVMTHKDKVIEIGDAAYAFSNWVAEEDLEKK